ncbi:MAG: serpin family protein [Bdellovibrionales bacterium]|nr:serpin family protein [Bdellovibrionales bacterium]
MKILYVLLTLMAITSCTKKEVATPEEEMAAPASRTSSTIKGSDYPAPISLKPGEASFQILKLHTGQPRNFAHSPLSLKMAFEMVYPAAGENARLALEAGFGFSSKESNHFKAERDLSNRLNHSKDKNSKLLIGNSIWLKNPKILSSSYLAHLKSISAQVSPLSLKEINLWVKSITEGKIPSLLESLDQRIAFVAVNAIYFKGDWAAPFEKAATMEEPFRNSETASHSVKMMRKVHSFRFHENDDSKWLEIPYKDSPLSMILVLPRKDFDLKTVESRLDSASVSDTMTKMKEERIELALPKFKMSEKSSLKEDLLLAGYSKLFAPGEWVSISADPDFSLGDVVQAISLDVDEQGTTAAAATALTMETTSLDLKPKKQFLCNQPFLYLLLNRESSEIYFMGRVYKPE